MTRAFAITLHALSLYAHCTKNPCPNRPAVRAYGAIEDDRA